jgi:hypothetical protein
MGYHIILKYYSTNSDWLAGNYTKSRTVEGGRAWATVEAIAALDKYEVVEVHTAKTDTIGIYRKEIHND